MKYTLLFQALLACIVTGPLHAAKPNVIVIYTDDQGSVDMNCYGATDLRTPSMDGLAEVGTRFTQFYSAAPVCSPSRAALMTGRVPQRAGAAGNVSSEKGHAGMPSEQITLAEMMKSAGYATGHVGKWHLGYTPATMPGGQGFDETFGHMGGCIDNYSHFFYWQGPNRHDLWHNGEEIWRDGQFFPDLMVAQGKTFIEDNRARPFFLYWAINLPHYPLQGTSKWREYYADLPHPRKEYAAFISTMDEAIGQLLGQLDALGLRENTIVILQSDHGHSQEERTFSGGGSAGVYRGAKFSLFEGGIRVPAIISWPGRLPQGEVREQLATACDWYPTIAELCGIEPASHAIDGKSIVPIIRSADAESPHDTFHWQSGGGKARPQWAVRQGAWKLIGNPNDTSHKGTLSNHDRLFLVNLDQDISEMNNIAAQHPEKVKALVQAHEAWVADVEHPSPVVAPSDAAANADGAARGYQRFTGLREYNTVAAPTSEQTVVLTRVTLIDGRGGPPLENAAVIIEGNKIAAVGKAAELDFPIDAEVHDLEGSSVLPGLIDTHFHIGSNATEHEIPSLFLSHGVTAARDPGRPIEVYAPLRQSEISVPRLFLTGPHFDQPPPAWPDNAVIIASPAEAEEAVKEYIDSGASGIKIYFRLTLDCIEAACEAAHRENVPVTAHLELVDADAAIRAGLDGIEHITSFGTTLADPQSAVKFKQAVESDNAARGDGRYRLWASIRFDDNQRLRPLLDLIVANHTFVSPTLATFERRASSDTTEFQVQGFENMLRFVGLCHAAGAKVVTGSHTWSRHVDLGWAYQREMELLVESGLSPLEAISASTLNAARFLGCADRLGTLEAGKLADLVLVKGRPDQDIRNMYDIQRVMLNGNWVANAP